MTAHPFPAACPFPIATISEACLVPGEAGHRVLPPPSTYFTSDSAKPYPDVPALWGKGHGDQAEAETPAGAGEGGRQGAKSSHGQWKHPRLLETYGLLPAATVVRASASKQWGPWMPF